jgi:hypothetical protein
LVPVPGFRQFRQVTAGAGDYVGGESMENGLDDSVRGEIGMAGEVGRSLVVGEELTRDPAPAVDQGARQ